MKGPGELTTVELFRAAARFIESDGEDSLHLAEELARELYARATRLEGETGQQNPIGRHTAQHINAPRRAG